MRMHWMLLSLVAGGAAVAAAQSTPARVGVFGGLNMAHVDGDVSDISNHKGPNFGAYFAAPINDGWAFQVGAGISSRGWEREEPGTQDLNVVKLSYFEVPLLMRYDFAAESRVGGFIMGGAGLGFRSGCELSGTVHASGVTQTFSCDEVDRLSNGSVKFNSFDTGAILGGGLRIAAGREQLVLSAQYEHGLMTVQNDREIKSRAFTFGAGVEIPLHRK